ncbi:sigma 54-interacting transcriptional regulator [Desulfogranum japonicum]|uniref:sigma 54-interacting transcriptional regulator n=1 Tax=Desulfogranum japonicum TaxID=231447 RepID=UPI0004154EDF|nr:sigma 54-interacting transcriptional regulator [Desulfogranum japonicum]
MKVVKVMDTEIAVLSVDDSLQQAAKLLEQTDRQEIVVVHPDFSPAGLLSHREILRAIGQGMTVDGAIGPMVNTHFGVTDPDSSLSALDSDGYGHWIVYAQGKPVGLVRYAEVAENGFQDPRHLFRHLGRLMESVQLPVLVQDISSTIVVANSTACQVIGLASESIISHPIGSILTSLGSEDRRSVGTMEFIQRFRLHGVTYMATWAPVNLRGKEVGACAILGDCTESEVMFDELSHARDVSKELSAIIESSFDGIYVTDGRSRTLRVNRAYERITGIKSNEVVGKTMTDLVEGGMYNESATLRVLREKHPVTIVQNIMKTGKTIVATGNPVFDEQGNIFRVVTNVRDVTELNRLQEQIEKMEQLQSRYEMELQQLRKNSKDHKRFVLKSKKMKEIYALALKLAKVDSTILIQGDSGVGKEVFCEIIHSNGVRQKKPFIKISCAAIPENLLESELFGYAPGSFTGASKEGRAGIFEVAHGGTIFLDEIGEMPMSLQVKLLRVLQEREIVRIGGSKPIKVDTRIVAATNRDLEEMVKNKDFRKDLFFRLNVVPVMIPPLRERKEAISHFIFFFLEKHNKKYGFSRQITPEAVDAMIEYDWPGNVRELENLIERLVVMSQGEIITADDLPSKIRSVQVLHNGISREDKPLKAALAEFEYQLLSAALEKYGSSRKAAMVLGINQSTVVRKANRLGIRIGTE